VEEGRRARRALTVLVAGEGLAVVALHRLGTVDGFAIPRRDFARWLHATPSEDVLLAGIRLAALVTAWWLLATTLLYVGARLAQLHGAVRAVGWATLPGVRRWADRAAAVSIVAASALGAARPAAAGPPPPTGPARPPVVIDLDHRDRSELPHLPPVSVRTGHRIDAPRVPSVPSGPPPETAPLAEPGASSAHAAPPPAPGPPPAPAHRASHAIERGEHLWSIAAQHLASGRGRARADLTAAEIAPYWWRLVVLNRSRLRSGNPNLVYPGETIELPPP
jgi:hypothetical protein